MHSKRQKLVRNVLVPRFGPRGCDVDAWTDYARHARAAFGDGSNGDAVVGAWSDTTLRHVKKRPRTADQLAAALEHRNTRVINVQAPWGQVIRDGTKDVENRPDAFPCGGGWMVIVSSKANFSKPEWNHRNSDIARRLKWAGVSDKVFYSQDQIKVDDQRAIAVAKVTSLNNCTASLEAKQSIWNNGDAYAWRIDEVYPLPTPVYYGGGSLGKPYFSRCNQTFKDQVRHQLLRNAAPAEEVEVDRVLRSLIREVCASV